MNKLFSRFFLLTCFISTISITGTAQVWPGDVNDNGIVDHYDFLLLAAILGEEGPPRPTQTIDFSEQTIDMLWGTNLPGTNIDLAFADCDGNGEIDFLDQVAIYENYNLEHGPITPVSLIEGIDGVDPPFFLESQGLIDPIPSGTPIIFDLILGTETQPVPEFQGIAFTIRFDPDVFRTDFIQFNPSPNIVPDFPAFSFLGGDMSAEDGTVEIALHRFDDVPLEDLAESLGTFFLVIEDDVVDFNEPPLDTYIALEGVQLVGEDFTTTPVFSDSIEITITAEGVITASVNVSPDLEDKLSIFPNPASDYLRLEASFPLQEIELLNLIGERVWNADAQGNQDFDLNLPDLPTGAYLLRVYSSDGVIMKKVILE